MKRFTISIGALLLTFTAGVIAAWGYYQISSILVSEVVVSPPSAEAVARGGADIQFLGSAKTDYATIGEFRVRNSSNEPAHYWGYGKESHCSIWLRRGITVERASNCWCGTGLSGQVLLPGESVTFKVRVPDTGETFTVGFDFTDGKNDALRTLWSESVTPGHK